MLVELRIRNLAVIEDLEITFEPGLNVITGETGAGKTILMRALGLLLGDRASTDLVRSGAEDAEIEALFQGRGVAAALSASAIDLETADGDTTDREGLTPLDDEITLRRVITAGGRQRAYVNDRLVTAARLGSLGEGVVHVYGQHEHHTLLRPETQRHILDEAGSLGELVTAMRSRFGELCRIDERLRHIRAGASELSARRDLLAYQVQELRAAAPRADESEELERERELLRHAERLREAASDAEQTLYSGESAMLDTLARLATRLTGLQSIDPELGAAARLIEEARPILEDAALRLGARSRAINADPERLEQVEERLALLQRLARKHGCSVAELVQRHARAVRELAELEGGDADPADLERQLAAAAEEAWRAAEALTAGRLAAANTLGRRVTTGLRELALKGAELTIALEPLAAGPATPEAQTRAGRALAATGAERIEFLFTANAGESALPLARIASGGELSRIMLALKAATASDGDVPTFLFDEVDAGIGGAVAEVVGRTLARLARGRQVICITHLPQIAACADHHIAVRKHTARGRARSSAERLSDVERVEELARMLGGVTITAEARRHAAELQRLGRRRS